MRAVRSRGHCCRVFKEANVVCTNYVQGFGTQQVNVQESRGMQS